jgi:hypothetical protein
MVRTLLKSMAVVILAAVSAPSFATLILTPDDADATTSTTSNLGSLTQINTAFGTSYSDLTLQYKANVDDGSEEGPLAGSYSTSFFNSPTDPSDADITYVGGAAIGPCPVCILIVKDGNNNPAQYLFDLGDWDGTEEIWLRGFWPRSGAISNVAIWSAGSTSVPEPGTLALLGAGLLGLGLMRRKRAA